MNDEIATAPRDWSRVKWTRAAQLAPMMGDALPMESVGALPPAAAFAVLRDNDPAGAANFVAQCLPRVDAVRWVLACLTYTDESLPPARAVAAKAVRRWLAGPSDDARRLAFQAGEIAGWDTMEGLACLAIFLSGGSMAPATQEMPVNPQPGVFGRVVASAVLVAAHAQGGLAYPDRIAAMLTKADALAAGEQPG
ncbi:hypothetical protein [Sphingomonas sp.]|uniref:DUF6931 family protein n=1 Tax=Sphingomonas sp. TaxID=28214 RepID=UPI0035BC06FF